MTLLWRGHDGTCNACFTRGHLGVVTLSAALNAAACSDGRIDHSPAGPALAEGAELAVATDAVRVAAGEEVLAWCQSFVLDNDSWLFIDGVELETTAGVHHSDWFVVAEKEFAGPTGTGDCEHFGFGFSLDREGLTAPVFSQSTQARRETVSFAPRTAFPVAPRSKLLVSYHLLNTSAEALDVSIEARFQTVREEDVEIRLSVGGGLLGLLALPPRSRSRFSADCWFAEPAHYRIFTVLPHYHQYGTGFELKTLGGRKHLQTIWRGEGAAGDSLSDTLTTPFELAGAEGVRFSCDYDNPTGGTIGVGATGADEMCSFFVHTDGNDDWYGVVSEGFGGATLNDWGSGEYGQHFGAEGCVVVDVPD